MKRMLCLAVLLLLTCMCIACENDVIAETSPSPEPTINWDAEYSKLDDFIKDYSRQQSPNIPVIISEDISAYSTYTLVQQEKYEGKRLALYTDYWDIVRDKDKVYLLVDYPEFCYFELTKDQVSSLLNIEKDSRYLIVIADIISINRFGFYIDASGNADDGYELNLEQMDELRILGRCVCFTIYHFPEVD